MGAHSYDICNTCLGNATGRLDQERAAAENAHQNEAARIEEEHRLAAENRQRQRLEFERKHPLPGRSEAQVTVRFRGVDGSNLERPFLKTALVSVLFDFVAIAEWS